MRDGWVAEKLGAVTSKIGSGATPRGGEESYKLAGIPLIRSLNVYDDGFRAAKLAKLDDEQAARLSGVVVEPNDVLFNITGASVARCCLAPAQFMPARVNQHVAIIRPIARRLDSALLRYLLISSIYKERLLQTGEAGSTRQAITKAQLQELAIEFPESFAEQQRIVGILDEAFEGIATAKANAEKNLQNAGALFESQLRSVFSQRGKGWVEKRLSDVAKTQYGLSKSMNEDGEGYKIFRMGELQDGRLIDTGCMKFADIDRAEFEKYRLRPGDILFNRTNSFELVGKTGLFDLPGDYCFASYLVRVLLDSGVMLPAFLNYFMSSERFQVSVKRKASRSINQANINATILANETVIFPESLKEQRAVVTLLDRLREETRRLEFIYQRKLTALDELKQSLLHQAFSADL